MRVVFADTLYWIALVRPHDPWAAPAKQARAALGQVRIVTTEEVLVELLTALSAGGPRLRRGATRMVRKILANPAITVLAQSHDSFLSGLQLYEQRPDKEYSLTDCITMQAMRTAAVGEILTNDHHFTQEGFTILINRSTP